MRLQRRRKPRPSSSISRSHVGQTGICHGRRVGAEVRQWTERHAWVFDDTIEHEAWNESGELRAVLIFDVWNPLLEKGERSDLCGVIEAIDAHYGRVIDWQDRP